MDGADLRFGAPRGGHTHQGQDILAPEGTPIVAPLAGTVSWSANQPAGAGIYVVIRGSDGRDYVFMHIRPKTLLVEPSDTVSAGQQIAEVGHTGDAQGPHLHFEIWVGGWYEKGGVPIDPLPDLQHWVGLR
jgi:murein DD-endopeptidase MepM/ murein hydrolase activator NlpD